MKHYLRFLLIAAFCGIFCIPVTVLNGQSFQFSELIMYFGMRDVNYFPPELVDVIHFYLPLLLFQIFYGTYIYRHFCTASIYYFSRNCRRTVWFLKEAAVLYIFSFLYILTMIVCGIAATHLIGGVTVDSGAWGFLVLYLLIYSLHLFVFTLGINLAAILFTSNVGFIIVEGINFFTIVAYTMVGKFFVPEQSTVLPKQYEWTLKRNPFWHLVFHADKDASDYRMSVLLFAVGVVILLICGCIIVDKHNFIESNREMGGE